MKGGVAFGTTRQGHRLCEQCEVQVEELEPRRVGALTGRGTVGLKAAMGDT